MIYEEEAFHLLLRHKKKHDMNVGIALPAYRGLLRTPGCEHRSNSALILDIPSWSNKYDDNNLLNLKSDIVRRV